MQAKSHLGLVAPTEKRAVPGRRSDSDYRKREYLTPAEIEKLIAAEGDQNHEIYGLGNVGRCLSELL
jgi:hypothetical protein